MKKSFFKFRTKKSIFEVPKVQKDLNEEKMDLGLSSVQFLANYVRINLLRPLVAQLVKRHWIKALKRGATELTRVQFLFAA